MDWHIVAGVLSGVLALSAYVCSFYLIRRQKWSPSPVTWGIWTLVDLLLFIHNYLIGNYALLPQLIIYFGGALTISILVLGSNKKATKYDTLCVLTALSGLAVWWLYRSSEPALVLTVVAHLIGSYPSLEYLYKAPLGERNWVWPLFAASSLISLLAVQQWGWQNWPHWLWPVYGFPWCLVSVILIAFPRWRFRVTR